MEENMVRELSGRTAELMKTINVIHFHSPLKGRSVCNTSGYSEPRPTSEGTVQFP